VSFAADIDDARLTVLLDVRHPLAYLALHPTIELARHHGLEVNWLPVLAPPLHAPSRPHPDDDRGVRHRRIRAQAIAREIETYGQAQGLVVREYYRAPDPTALNAGWLWVRAHARNRLEDYLVRVFRAYWACELDPSETKAVAPIISALDADEGAFEIWSRERGAASLASLAEELAQRGIGGAPCYWIDGELFLGRQHLPMIRWILAGRSGRGPI